MSFKFREETDGNVVVINAPNRVDVNVSDELRELLTSQIEKNKYQFIVDLSKTKYMDSSGLGSIVSRIAVTRSNNGDIRIAGASENVNNLLNLTHLNKILKIFPDVKSALESYKKTTG